jgi:hypothetical protein
MAQPGVFGTYADAAGTTCNVTDASAGLLTIWIVHTLTANASAGQYSAPTPACMLGASFLADAAIGPAVGGSHTGSHAVGYGGCLGAPIAVNAMSFFGAGLSTACCAYPVLPDANTGLIEMVDCNSTKHTAAGLSNTVNGNSTCDCNATPTEDATWGAVKSLYNTQ